MSPTGGNGWQMKQARQPSQRQRRVGELIRHALAELLQRGALNDPEIDRLGVTIHEVTTSPDLKVATAWVRPLLSDDKDGLLAVLERRRRHIRHLLAPQLKLKFVPDIRFRYDTSQDQARRIEELLNHPAVARDLGANADETNRD